MTGEELMCAVVQAAHYAGWYCAHFRPCKTSKGWRTAVQFDGRGYPDLTMVHPERGVLFVEIKGTHDRLSAEQAVWLAKLAEAGAEVHVWSPEEWRDGSIDACLGLLGRVS